MSKMTQLERMKEHLDSLNSIYVESVDQYGRDAVKISFRDTRTGCGGAQISKSLFRKALNQHWNAIWDSMIAIGKREADILRGEAIIEAATFIHNETPPDKEQPKKI